MPHSCGRPSARAGLFLALMAVWLWGGPASGEICLKGRLEQGGLALGQVAPGARVTLDGRPVPVDSQGRYVVGFGRDAESMVQVKVVLSDGREETRALAIARRDWPVQSIDGVPRDKVEPDKASLARLRAETEMLRALRADISFDARFLDGLVRPAEGVVSGVFGSQRVYNGIAGAPHSGLDIAAPQGTPVHAAAAGKVVLAAPDLFLTGRTIMIDHGLGVISSYGHLSRLDVAAGAKVGRGQIIGAVGATGLATGAHLHWGMSWLDVRLDPETAAEVLGF
ncbi:MAG: M23 family metallopeptidase [Magnetospirillum sp.]|nr:M23 family metallopeptidase [Magnetospirillum sp.]